MEAFVRDHIMTNDPAYKRFIPFIVSFAFFMEALDTTIINTAIPAMAQSLAVNPVDLKIALISYLLSLAVFIPISGWLADRMGAKPVLLSALSIFSLASLWCGFSHSLLELVIARTFQGMGGAMMLPVGRLILVRTFARHELINTMSRVIIVGALGVMLGPVLGGVITHYFSWHWIFWVNLPVGLFTITMVTLLLPHTQPKKVPPLDKLGFILFGISLAGFTFSLSIFSESGEHTLMATAIMLSSILLMMLYILHSRRKKHPIVKVELFYLRTFRISVFGNLFSRLGFGGMPFLMPLLFQIALGYSAQASGFLIAPIALGILAIKPFTLGYKKLLITNTLCVGLGLCAFSFISNATPWFVIAIFTFIYGFLTSTQYSGMNSLAYIEISEEHLSAATSIMSTLQQISQSFGVAIGALLLRYFSSQSAHGFTLSIAVFHHTFLALGMLTLLSTLIFLNLKPHDGDQMIYGTEAPAS
jgi:EmrB/QacA subfamily drug resistance transporter